MSAYPYSMIPIFWAITTKVAIAIMSTKKGRFDKNLGIMMYVPPGFCSSCTYIYTIFRDEIKKYLNKILNYKKESKYVLHLK